MKKDEQISNALGIAHSPTTDITVIEPTAPLAIKTPEEEKLAADAKEDYESSREILRDLMVKGKETAESAMEVAQGTQAARQYEAAARLIESVASLAMQLQDLGEKTRRVRTYDDPAPAEATVTINEAAFEGTMAELLELAEKTKKKKNAKDT